jgi:hypothetical protein
MVKRRCQPDRSRAGGVSNQRRYFGARLDSDAHYGEAAAHGQEEAVAARFFTEETLAKTQSALRDVMSSIEYARMFMSRARKPLLTSQG